MRRTVADIDNREEVRKREQLRRNQAIIDLLHAWQNQDATEQRETVEFLMRMADEDRMSDRKLFA